tara:strand:+ start:456 stop:1067 length:612 start_codon:yes stop_codon:yes gene_type:complete
MQFETTTKLFYGKFPYKAVMEKESFDLDQYYNNMRKMIEWLKTLKKFDYQMRHSRDIQLFFRKRKELEYVANNYGKWVSKVFEPLNKKHYEYLMKNRDTVTRNRLFWNRYPYKITFGCHTEIDKAVNWFENFFTDKDPLRYRFGSSLSQLIREKERWRSYWCNPVLYLTEHDDVMLCKLALNSHIVKIESAVTFDQFRKVNNE